MVCTALHCIPVAGSLTPTCKYKSRVCDMHAGGLHMCAHVPMLLQVLEVRWWMGHYKSKTPKRHKAWTNNAACARLDMGTLNMKRFRQQHGWSGAVRKTISKEGRRGYVGTKQLKGTQHLPQLLPFHKMHSSSIHVCLCYDALCWFVC